ncbi:thioesterase II family protein [Allorhizocola rhizosphaerae]|uniref:thioesterase II family protein n=1 Tax=Allorhizocola rhizosphaerae TaxID=1872709 RepID=UPI001FE7573F|nr:alpha/beta fold hydrolase [Allorhizocola rhizosphaerae]
MSLVPEDVVWTLRGDATDQTLSLLVLPHAGGSAHTYAQWRELLPGNVRLLIGQYPGRGARFTEELPRSIDDLAGPILRCLPADTDDLVVLGHSMGSLVAFEIARALTLAGRPPRAFVASACRAPYLPNPSPVYPERLSDDELIAAIKERGGTEDGILDEPELREIVLPPIRADFAIDDAYRFTGEVESLTCPATVVGGAEDPVVPVGTLPDWSRVTSGPSEVRVLPGGHFYFQQEMAAFMSIVHAVLMTRHQFA